MVNEEIPAIISHHGDYYTYSGVYVAVLLELRSESHGDWVDHRPLVGMVGLAYGLERNTSFLIL